MTRPGTSGGGWRLERAVGRSRRYAVLGRAETLLEGWERFRRCVQLAVEGAGQRLPAGSRLRLVRPDGGIEASADLDAERRKTLRRLSREVGSDAGRIAAGRAYGVVMDAVANPKIDVLG